MAKKYFKPEFLNRVDDVVIFHKLERPALLEIVKLEVQSLAKRLANSNIKLQYGDDLLEYLLDKGFEPEYGARPLRRAIQRMVEDALSEEIIAGRLNIGEKVRACVSEDKLQFEKSNHPA